MLSHPHDDENTLAARRQNKKKARQAKWLVRQERSKLSREEIELLRMKCADLRKRLDDREAARNARMHSEQDPDHGAAPEEEERYLYFNELPISQRTQLGLERGNYSKMTPIQSDALYLALAGYDVLGAAKTGSGKTLCFVLPVLERLFLEHWDAEMGVGAIILSPTRELALQIFKVMQVVGYKHVLSAALLTGGRDVDEEKKRMHAISIMVGTPGRILHHLQDDASLVLDNLQLLCMDEADRLLDMGFREAVTSILKYLPTDRQTLMFSATQTTDVNMLAQVSLRNPRYVTSQAITSSPTPSTLCQNFLVVELHRKLDVLLMFLKRHPNDKIVVFVSTCNQVKFMYLAFSKILKKMRIPSMCLTSKMRQFRREEVFLTFCRCKSAVLFSTDVAARGLDFPLVHWVVQYDCPESAQTYIHRAGRTARAGARGVCLLMLTPQETPMLSYLANKNVVMREIAVRPSFLHDSHEIFVALVVQGLKYEAQKAFVSYLRSVYFASNKHVFNVTSIDVEAFAKSMGLLVVPDLSELQRTQRSAKNLPWDVVNYLAKQSHSQDRRRRSSHGEGNADDDAAGGRLDREGEASGDEEKAQPMTRKEKHLKASDMFRMLQQKQRYARKADDNDDDENDEDDGFLTKKPKEAEAESNLKLTADERLAGLSKSKRRRFVENPDLRVRDLGLNTRIIYSSGDDDDDEDDKGDGKGPAEEVKAPRVKRIIKGNQEEDDDDDDKHGARRVGIPHPMGVADTAEYGDNDSEKSNGGEGDFAKKLWERVQGQKEADADRAKRLRRLRKLQKLGKAPRKQTLEGSGAAGGAGKGRSKHSDDESSNEYVSSDDENSEGGASADVESGNDRDDVYHGIESSEDNHSDDDDNNNSSSEEDEEEAHKDDKPLAKPAAKRPRKN